LCAGQTDNMKGGTKSKQIELSRSVRALAAVSELRAKIDASAAKL